MSALPVVGALALLPAMLGPLDAESGHLALALCAGGTLTIELPGQPAPPPGAGPCCAKGCQTAGKRKRIDRAQ